MRIIIDANRVIASLVKESTTRKILLDSCFTFIAPEFIETEIRKYKPEIIKIANISNEEFEILLSLLFERINIINKQAYEHFMKQCKEEIKDPKDIPYLACALLTNAEAIWTHDPHFKGQQKVKVYTNINMLRISGKASS